MEKKIQILNEGYQVPEFRIPCEIFGKQGRPYGHWNDDPRKKDGMKLLKTLLQLAGIALAIIAIIVIITSTAHAEGTDAIGFPSYWDHDSGLVTKVQESLVLHELLPEKEIDGHFGPKTAKAVKDFQLKNGIYPSGVVNDETATKLGLSAADWPYNQGWTLYYMANLQAIYDRKSNFEDMIYICLGGRGYNKDNPEATGSHLFIYRDGKLIADCSCITGNESKGYFTPLGTRSIKGRHEEDTGKWSKYYYLVHINEKIFIQSTLEYFDESRDHQVLGAHISDGSIRIPKQLAEWIYKNEPNGVLVVIDDRAYSPYNAPGWEHLIEEDGEYSEYADWEENDGYEYYDEEAQG